MQSVNQPGSASRRRRPPAFVRGVRRVAGVLTALAAIVCILRIDAGGNDFAVLASALGQVALVWALYFGIEHFSMHPPARMQAWLKAVLKARHPDHSELAQVVHLVSWAAAIAAVALVMLFPQSERSGAELATALVIAVVLSVGAVRLVGWIVRGFVRPE